MRWDADRENQPPAILGVCPVCMSDGQLWPDTRNNTRPTPLLRYRSDLYPFQRHFEKLKSTKHYSNIPGRVFVFETTLCGGKLHTYTPKAADQAQGEHNGRLLINVYKVDMVKEGDTDTDSWACEPALSQPDGVRGANYKCRTMLASQLCCTD